MITNIICKYFPSTIFLKILKTALKQQLEGKNNVFTICWCTKYNFSAKLFLQQEVYVYFDAKKDCQEINRSCWSTDYH